MHLEGLGSHRVATTDKSAVVGGAAGIGIIIVVDKREQSVEDQGLTWVAD